jgi:hypothetical protein
MENLNYFLKALEDKLTSKSFNLTINQCNDLIDKTYLNYLSIIGNDKFEYGNSENNKILPMSPINPEHYRTGSIEVIDMMILCFGKDNVKTFCEINAFKYRMRAGKKENSSIMEDINKAIWFESLWRTL